MAKTYNVMGPIVLENLSNTQALGFVATVVAEVPAHSMGTASINIRAQGPAEDTGTTVSGDSLETLQASLAKAQSAPKPAEDIVYDVRGAVNLVGMSHAECLDLIDTVMNAIPIDSMTFTTMVIQQEAVA